MPEINFEKCNITVLLDEEDYLKTKNFKLVARKEKSGNRAIKIRMGDLHFSIASKIFNVPKGMMIHHNNGNQFDFRRSEISIVSRQEYSHRNSPHIRSQKRSSKYLRVHRTNKFHPWMVKIEKDGKIFGGRYDDEIEAAIVSDYLAYNIYGDVATRNFPELSIDEISQKYNQIISKYGTSTMERYSKSAQGVSTIKVRTKTSNYVGVCRNKRKNKWEASISHLKNKVWLGLFTNEIDAAKAYDKKALELYGEDAKINFPK